VTAEAFYDGLLGWIIWIAGLFWLLGGFALLRQIRIEMALDSMTSRLEEIARDLEHDAAATDGGAPARRKKSTEEEASELWQERDDTARRGWIAGQAVVLIATALAMMMLHSFAAGLAALLVLGQGVYFIWREWTARRAPTAELAAHARPTPATVNAGWVSFAVAMLVWAAAFRGLLN